MINNLNFLPPKLLPLRGVKECIHKSYEQLTEKVGAIYCVSQKQVYTFIMAYHVHMKANIRPYVE